MADRRLQVFYTVVKAGSFTKAGDQLDLGLGADDYITKPFSPKTDKPPNVEIRIR